MVWNNRSYFRWTSFEKCDLLKGQYNAWLLTTDSTFTWDLENWRPSAGLHNIKHFPFCILWFEREIYWYTIQMNYAVNGKYSQAENHMLWIYFHLWGCSNMCCNSVSWVFSWGLSNQPLSNLICPFQHSTLR